VGISRQAYADILAKPAIARVNAPTGANPDDSPAEVPPSQPELPQLSPLAGYNADPGPVLPGGPGRFFVRFDCYMVRPQDWDNTYVKPLQDALRKSKLIHDDAWNQVSGQVVCHRVPSFPEEKTVITITRLS
jgi:hypothetical protein